MMMVGEADDDDDDEDDDDDDDEDDDDATAATCPVGTDGSLPTPLRTEEVVEVAERPSSPHHRRHRCHLRDNWNKNDRRDSWIGRDVMGRC